MASTPVRPSPLSPFESANSRQSPFRRQNSVSPATVRATNPAQSPTKASANLSPTKNGSLSPEKTSPFVRRPSQINSSTARPSSPFARPTSGLSVVSSPTRKSPNEAQPSSGGGSNDDLFRSSVPKFAGRHASVTPVSDEDDVSPTPVSHSPFISTAATAAAPSSPTPHSPLTPTPRLPTQASLRPVSQRPLPTPATSTIPPPPKFNALPSAPPPLLPTLGQGAAGGTYTHLAPGLLHSMRESFEVLDGANAGQVGPGAVAEMLAQLNLAHDAQAVAAFFPTAHHQHNGQRSASLATAAAPLNLARYLEALSAPLADLSPPDELRAAFEAFDLEDSGQIDVATLRQALLRAGLEGEDGGMGMMGERDIDAVLGEFTGRRAFGMGPGGKGSKGGEVFRYRDFMASVSAGPNGGEGGHNAQGVAA